MNFRHFFYNSKLADPVVDVDLGVAHGEDRHVPLVIITAVRFINHAHVIGLDDAEILKRGTARDDMGFISFWQLHGNAQRNEGKVSLLKSYLLGGPQIDPI